MFLDAHMVDGAAPLGGFAGGGASMGKTASSAGGTSAVSTDTKAEPLPPGSIINFEADRAAIEQAITDYYDISLASGSEFQKMKNLDLQKVTGNQVEVDARYTTSRLYDGDMQSRASRFTLKKENNAYTVLEMKRS
jgi:hypothetical protein